MLVSLVALNVLKKISKLEKWAGPVLDVSMVVFPICFTMIATAIGYSFSIPLALLLTASNVAIHLFTS